MRPPESLDELRPTLHNYAISQSGHIIEYRGPIEALKAREPATYRNTYIFAQIGIESATESRGFYCLPIPIHVLIAHAWLGPKPTPAHMVDHIDRDKYNNHYSNLRWATARENRINMGGKRQVRMVKAINTASGEFKEWPTLVDGRRELNCGWAQLKSGKVGDWVVAIV